jgi:hypothetical protein
VRPDERHGGARWSAKEEFSVWYIGSIPDLFRDEAAFVGKSGQRPDQLFGNSLMVCR